MKIKEQTRKLAAGCSKQCFEVVDRTDEVSNHTYGKVKLTWFEEIFEEYKMILLLILYHMGRDEKTSSVVPASFFHFKLFLIIWFCEPLGYIHQLVSKQYFPETY